MLVLYYAHTVNVCTGIGIVKNNDCELFVLYCDCVYTVHGVYVCNVIIIITILYNVHSLPS